MQLRTALQRIYSAETLKRKAREPKFGEYTLEDVPSLAVLHAKQLEDEPTVVVERREGIKTVLGVLHETELRTGAFVMRFRLPTNIEHALIEEHFKSQPEIRVPSYDKLKKAFFKAKR